jgi:hypothetical protein
MGGAILARKEARASRLGNRRQYRRSPVQLRNILPFESNSRGQRCSHRRRAERTLRQTRDQKQLTGGAQVRMWSIAPSATRCACSGVGSPELEMAQDEIVEDIHRRAKDDQRAAIRNQSWGTMALIGRRASACQQAGLPPSGSFDIGRVEYSRAKAAAKIYTAPPASKPARAWPAGSRTVAATG